MVEKRLKFSFFNDDHNVYTAIKHLLSSLGELSNYDSILKEKNKEKLYIVRPATFYPDAYIALLKNLNFLIYEEYFYRDNYKDSIASLIMKLFSNKLFISFTKRTSKFLEDNKAKYFYLPPAYYPSFNHKKKNFVINISRLVEEKNIEFFLKIVEKNKDIDFVLVGKGPLEKVVLDFLKHHNNLTYYEYIERKKLLKIISESSLLLLPSKKESVGFVLIEALSRATPVLSALPVGASDFLDKEWVLDNFDVDVWSKKIREMLNNVEENSKKAKEMFIKNNLDLTNKDFFDSKKKEFLEKLNELYNI